MDFIDLKTQYKKYKKEIDQGIQEVLDASNYIMGAPVQEVEKKLADYAGTTHCVTTSSGTDSLLIALMALGVKQGDEVITTPYTWISTLEVIALLGAKAVLVDIEEDTYNLRIDQIEEKITDRTKAIMPVSLFGQMPDYQAINAIADRYDIAVIEDGAQSFGATRDGTRSCGATLIGSTSFFPAKPLGCYGDGGALFTSDEELARSMRAIRNHGGERRHCHTQVGLNGRFDTMQAAVLLAKLPHFEGEVQARCEIGARYSELLQEDVITPKIDQGCTHIYAQYTIRSNNRDDLQAALKEQKIPTGIYYPIPCHLQPVFKSWGYKEGDFPVSERVAKQVLSLPMHPFLTKQDQDTVVEAVKAFSKNLSLATQ